ncbi:DUF2848 family protein [Virgibacillus oceani]|uniref:DUF2848 domain-containing protein n=1 Tax=Virgibacillus oceani TaxID=1479511 RepID=A0A917M5Z7_9BACI|nr:DUF2848 family protein [Virgibacillus oceani]GGG79454.1 hypothetical protein GCM10011398_25990 [Virgibacillus oceani]
MTTKQNNLTFQMDVEGEAKDLKINKAFCIGYTGRDKEQTWMHIKELAEIGVPEPNEVPALYPVGVSTLSQAGNIEVVGDQTSGEAEIVLIFGDSPEECYLSVGSDHTDRSLETVDINKSKQVCDKPFAAKAWKIDKVIKHWDQLVLSSEILVNGKWEAYQENPISAIITLEEIKGYLEKKNVPFTNSIVFSGTVPLLDGFKYGATFRMTLSDPILDDSITTEYEIVNIAE